ncbi:catalase family peroxidase [Labrys monachus]|uniref:Catalase-related peroxidase n=1 Tax=Labrys monachus TaxID=217067 RepID=A0ABU0FAN2_9HYPH|nr:catalase family peroxidase [Labrys monachus]MDQ0391677.1 catalase [Labrys monachus]
MADGTTPAKLGAGATMSRLAVIGAAVAAMAGGFAYAGGWLSPGTLTPARLVDQFERDNGVHAGFRRNHAKGVCVGGFFEGSGEASGLSKAQIFARGRVPVIGRFALAGGQPYAADAAVTVRSMALRFTLPDGEEWRTGMNDIPVFAVSTPQGFYDQLVASRPDAATGKPDPARMKAFLDRHPETARAVAAIKAATPSSGFADSTFNSLDAFRFVNADGVSTPVRWATVPVGPATSETPAQTAQTDKNYLFDALIAAIGQHPLQWRLVVTIGQPGDPTDDATIAWPAGRRTVDAGTLTIDHIEGEATGPCRDLNFDPLVLPAGIEPSDDPLLSARSAAYAQSFTRRAGEARQPSAVATPARTEGQNS